MLDNDNDPVDTGDDDGVPVEGGDGDTGGLDDQSDTSTTGIAGEGDGTEPVEGERLEAVRQQSTASQRIQQEITRRKALEGELDTYRKHVLDMQRQQAATRPVTEDPEEERRRLEFMDEPQRIQYLVDKGVRAYQTDVSRLRLEMNVQADRTGFAGYLASNPQFKKYADEVEAEFNKALQNGQPKSRAEILTMAIGTEVIKKGAAAVGKARQIGQDNLRRQQTKPGAIRSGATGSGRGAESAEDILKRRLARGEYSS